jgi:16S rRNA processing protein RimM
LNKPAPHPRLINLGQVVGVHGLRGLVKLGGQTGPEGSDPALFPALGEVHLGGQVYRVAAASRKKRQILLQLQEVETRHQAELLVGLEVQAEADRFPALPAGEYYCFQLLGLPVWHARTNICLGHLEEILPTPAHDVYVVRQGGREVLFPAVEEVITEINLKEGWIKVLPPDGLLEAYAD